METSMMPTRRQPMAAGAGAELAPDPARAQEPIKDKLKAVASFSILGDFVRNVGGERVEVAALVGPDGNAHVYAPSPADAKRVADARLVFVNGLGFEGWLDRLVKASGTKATIVVASRGIKARERANGSAERGKIDPHAWQSVSNAKIYVANIRNALVAAEPARSSDYDAHVMRYLAQL